MKTNNKNIYPCSFETEKILIIYIIQNQKISKELIYNININDFFFKNNKNIFFIIKKLLKNQKNINIINIKNELHKLNLINSIYYIESLQKHNKLKININDYYIIIKEKSTLRKIIKLSFQIIKQSIYNEFNKINNLTNKIIFLINKIKKKNNINELLICNQLKQTINNIENLYKKKSNITGISSGFYKIDKITSGFQKSDLIIIAGRPSMGKTTFLINLIENFIKNYNQSIIFFSIEMSIDQLIMKIMSLISKIKLQKIKTGTLTKKDWNQLFNCVIYLSKKKIFIIDKGNMDTNNIEITCEKILNKHKKIGLIIIDYIQLIQNKNHNDNRTVEMSKISRSLKLLAKKINSPIIAISQLNRNLEYRINKRPIMSDIRESGSIEQDADLIMFIYRDEVYNKKHNNSNLCEIIISKQRNGPTGTVYLTFLPEYSKFNNI